ncbi:hypothetical protein V1512DRAFT_262227 [Lipomyces arxii]|uniref:uncharacterized protein n=1 Tax=Lipomyces arxii TaxID=56418 RepID=UPI0034CEF01D
MIMVFFCFFLVVLYYFLQVVMFKMYIFFFVTYFLTGFIGTYESSKKYFFASCLYSQRQYETE